MPLVLGIDSSTQSCKALLVDADTGEVVAEQKAQHPTGTQVDPQAWVDALTAATSGLIERADAVAVAGQQHGMVPLNGKGEVVREAMLWNDVSSAEQAHSLNEELGGAAETANLIGSVLVASFTGTKLRWLKEKEPENAARTQKIAVPHDYLTWVLGGKKELTTDHGDASGTGYYSPHHRRFMPELAAQFIGHELELPRIVEPNQIAGQTSNDALLAAGTGDNMAAALGLGLKEGDVCVSIGTSGVASMVTAESVHDETGLVAGFCDATGKYLPLACTLNGAKVLDFSARMLGVDHDGLAQLALHGEPGAHGVVLLPYLDGERTPNRPLATGVFSGITTTTSREDIARAVFEGILCSLADAVKALECATGYQAQRVILTGGGARNIAMRTLAPSIFGTQVIVPEPAEYVALGAARQAAWALSQSSNPPHWGSARTETFYGECNSDVLEAYAQLRDATVDF